MILNESYTVTAFEISDDIKEILEIFQEALSIIYKYYHSTTGDKRGKLVSIDEFKKLKREIRRFHNYPFMKPVMDHLNQLQQEIINHIQSKRTFRKVQKYNTLPSTQSIIDIWKTGNITASIQASSKYHSLVNAAGIKSSDPLQNKVNPFYIENPLFFGSNNLLTKFEKSEILEVISKDFNQYKYSYMPLNELSKNNFQYIAYFILNLQTSPVKKQLSGQELSKYFDMTFVDNEYKKLISIVREYLRNNKKSNIPIILRMIEKFPEIYTANENAKNSITVVYRGYPDDPDHYKLEDPEFFATSKYRHVAKRFALQIGHLESEDKRRSEIGIIDTFKVNPDSILLDTTIFGGIFGEGEVIIYPSLAIHVNSEEI